MNQKKITGVLYGRVDDKGESTIRETFSFASEFGRNRDGLPMATFSEPIPEGDVAKVANEAGLVVGAMKTLVDKGEARRFLVLAPPIPD